MRIDSELAFGLCNMGDDYLAHQHEVGPVWQMPGRLSVHNQIA